MASSPQITVDKAYFYALLRRADFVGFPHVEGFFEHTPTSSGSTSDPTSNVFVPRDEYDALLQLSREYETLKQALYQGGVTPEIIDTLVSSARQSDERKDSAVFIHPNKVGTYLSETVTTINPTWSQSQACCSEIQNQQDRSSSSSDQSHLQAPDLARQSSYDMGGTSTSLNDDSDDLDLDECLPGSYPPLPTNGIVAAGTSHNNAARTIYFCGFPPSTSYSDLLSVVKGGKLASINMPSERSATISFLDPEAASKYLSWTKKNDVYIKNKRVDVRWAERHFTINSHVANKIQNGATRNLFISNAEERGLGEKQIRDDMEHIHGLIVIDVSFRNGDAYVSMNSIHNALFARTCMLSRKMYKGCKVQFLRDECDVPLPERMRPSKIPAVNVSMQKQRQGLITNRFDLLNTDGNESGNDVGSNETSEIDSIYGNS